MAMFDINEIKTVITHNVFSESSRTTYSVKTTYRAHTFVNQADSLEEAERIKETHVGFMVGVYAGNDYHYDSSTHEIVKVEKEVAEKETKTKKAVKVVVEQDFEPLDEVETSELEDEYEPSDLYEEDEVESYN